MDIQSAAANTNSGEESATHGKVFQILLIDETGTGKYFLLSSHPISQC